MDTPQSTAVEIKNLSKTFIIPLERRDTLKENFLRALQRQNHKNFHALNDITLTINKGDFFGIIGKNGSGKSTLLKLIGGIYTPNKGEITTNGTIAPFLELGVGFQPELSARENVTVNATLLGLTRAQIKEKYARIVEFAELHDFMELKIKNFSSGMKARLAFAIAKEADADIYLCDEVLAVGDEAFQQKCLEVFKQWKEQGKTVILVSHNAEQIQSLCNRAILLENGAITLTDRPHRVIERYRA